MFHPSFVLQRLATTFPGAIARILYDLFAEQINWPGTFPNSAPTVASLAGVITITKPVTIVSGALAITGISAPAELARAANGGSGYGARITFLPTGTFTWTTASNIALAGTAVVGKALDFTYDSATNKWYPSYIA
jgi:hypothetical protein